MSIRSTLKTIVPSAIRQQSRPVRKKILGLQTELGERLWHSWYKRVFFLNAQKAHQKRLHALAQKSRIRVLFLVVGESFWKLDSVFKAMQEDPFFEPYIFIYPEQQRTTDKLVKQRMDEAFEAFKAKGYPVILAEKESSKHKQNWKPLNAYAPDLLFFTRPHPLTHSTFYDDAYNNFLSTYIDYSHSVSQYADYHDQYDRYFHNAIWKIFVPHPKIKRIFKEHSHRRDGGIEVTGYPFAEAFFQKPLQNPWKNHQPKKIIWAPHHSIYHGKLAYSHFLLVSDWLKEFAATYKEEVQFAFKPHPILKDKLYQHAGWGKAKTDAYYDFWDQGANTQLETGAYSELFLTSDAMIHDSGSFLAEYHYLQKPVFYIADESIHNYLNPFGQAALKSCHVGIKKEDIQSFIEDIIHDRSTVDSSFFNEQLKPYFTESMPSAKIVASIKAAIQGA